MRIREMQEKYGLSKDDFWELKRGGRSIWIVYHDAIERIGVIENIVIEKPDWFAKGVHPSNTWACTVSGYKASDADNPARHVWTTGEASENNTKQAYPIAIAEKRAKDRLILKLINAYEYGIYSDAEADNFKKGGSTRERRS